MWWLATHLIWLDILIVVFAGEFGWWLHTRRRNSMWIVDLYGVDGGAQVQHSFATQAEAQEYLASLGDRVTHASAAYERPMADPKAIDADSAWNEIQEYRDRYYRQPKWVLK